MTLSSVDQPANDDEPADPRRPAEASVDDAVGCVGLSVCAVIIAFLLIGSVVMFVSLWL